MIISGEIDDSSGKHAEARTPPGPRKPLDCLVAGDANVDLLVDVASTLQKGKEIIARSMDLVLGGSSAITAHNLACLGARVGVVAVLGSDFAGRLIEERLRQAGVETIGLLRNKHNRTGITIWYGCGPDRAGVTYPGTIADLTSAAITDELLRRARHLHVGAYFLQTGLHRGASRLFQRARQLGLTTSLDSNFDPAEKWDSGIHVVLRHTDVFFPNEYEARYLSGCRKTEDAAYSLAAICRIVAVKMGAKGTLVSSGGQSLRIPAIKTRVVDTTGAGDSFDAGFLRAFLRGAGLRACARAGVRAGARCVTGIGGTAAFRRRP